MRRTQSLVTWFAFLSAFLCSAVRAQDADSPASSPDSPQVDQPSNSSTSQDAFARQLQKLKKQLQTDSSASEGISPEDRGNGLFGKNSLVFPLMKELKQLLQDQSSDDDLTRLKKERCLAACFEVDARMLEYRNGLSEVVPVLLSLDRLAFSLLALDPDDQTVIKIYEHNLEIAKQVETFTQKNFERGIGTLQERARARFERLTAEIRLKEVKRHLRKSRNELNVNPANKPL